MNVSFFSKQSKYYLYFCEKNMHKNIPSQFTIFYLLDAKSLIFF